jgi:hypothetical protein
MVKGESGFGRGRPAGGSARLQTENGFAFAVAPFPFSRASVRNCPERSRARWFCAAQRTLDGEDRLEDGNEGKGG